MSRDYTENATLERPNFRGAHPEIEQAVTLASSGADAEVLAGTVLGRVDRALGAATPGTNTGDGTVSGLALGAGAKAGVYALTCVAVATGGGTFAVLDPDGYRLADAEVGEAYAGAVAFTVNDGATDFVLGDSFGIEVQEPDPVRHAPWDPAAVDGRQRPCAVLAEDVTVPASGDEASVAYVHGQFRRAGLTFAPGADAAQVATAIRALARAGVHVK
ncbi:MAG: head decoration protein [Desulfovibrionaceae bacterium]